MLSYNLSLFGSSSAGWVSEDTAPKALACLTLLTAQSTTFHQGIAKANLIISAMLGMKANPYPTNAVHLGDSKFPVLQI